MSGRASKRGRRAKGSALDRAIAGRREAETKLLRTRERMFSRAMRASFDAAASDGKRLRPVIKGSGDYHLDPETRASIREICRDLLRNDPLFRALVSRRTHLTIGSGLRPQAATADKAWNDRAEALWRRDCAAPVDTRRRMTFEQAQAMALREVDVAGDFLTVFTTRGLQFAESEEIVAPGSGGMGGTTGQRSESPRIIDGVQLDEWGAPVAFHLAEYTDAMAGGPTLSYNTRSVPAQSAIFIGNHERVSQTRGVPAMAATVNRFLDLREYTGAALMQAKIAAFIALVWKSVDPAGTQSRLRSSGGADDDWEDEGGATRRRTRQDVEAGSVVHIAHDEAIDKVGGETPPAQFDPFWRSVIATICASLDVPPEVGLLDFTRTTYSSARAALLQSRTSFDGRRDWFARSWCARVWAWKVAGWVRTGELPWRDDLYLVNWSAPSMGQIDPEKEFAALVVGFQNNMIDFERVASLFGYDADELMELCAAQKAKMRELGILPEPAPGPGRPPRDGAEEPQKSGEDEAKAREKSGAE